MTSEHATDIPRPPMSETSYALLSPSSALYRWAQELRLTLSSQACLDVTDWHLQGHAVMLECNLIEEVPALLNEVAAFAGMTLYIFSSARVAEDFLDWIEQLPAHEPALVYLMPGDWMDPSSPASFMDPSTGVTLSCADAFLRALQGVIKGLGRRPVVLVTAVGGFEEMNLCLRQAGYFDRRIRVPERTADELVNAFLHELGCDLADESLRNKPERLGALLKAVFPDQRRRNLTTLALKRVAHRKQRLICFSDLVQMAMMGTTEDDLIPTDEGTRYRTAVHEAGHALVSHLDSSAMKAPTWCTAIKSRDCHGRMVASFEAPEIRGDDLSIANIQHKIRVLLAGRAAEHLVLGVEATSATGASADLEEATDLAIHMFGNWGIALETEMISSQASNLATVTNGGNPADNPRILWMARQCLQTEFMKATEILRKHCAYLHRIVQALCQQDVLIQEDFERLWAQEIDCQSRQGLHMHGMGQSHPCTFGKAQCSSF